MSNFQSNFKERNNFLLSQNFFRFFFLPANHCEKRNKYFSSTLFLFISFLMMFYCLYILYCLVIVLRYSYFLDHLRFMLFLLLEWKNCCGDFLFVEIKIYILNGVLNFPFVYIPFNRSTYKLIEE